MSDGHPTDSTDGADRADLREPSTAGLPRAPLDEQPTVITAKEASGALAPPRVALTRDIGPALVGTTLGHFRLDEFVGGGGMGVVYRAHDLSLDRSVAVKVLSQQQTEESLQRFRNEAQSAARLDHPHIARVYYVGEDRGWNYIVFEYIEGVNIRDLVSHRGPLPVEEVISYSLQIASALEHAWRRNVIHRDIKPSNILVMEDGQAKVVDMGLARLQQQPVEEAQQDLTASGVTLGTFDYISPEQARDPRSADVRSDLYSLGCTIYFMLTGQPPFPDGTVLQKLLSHSSDTPPDPRTWRSDIPDGLVAVLNRLLAKQPADRFQTPEEMMAALVSLADELQLAITDPLFRQPVRLERFRPVWWERLVPWSVAAALLLAAAILSDWIPYGLDDVVMPEPRFSDAVYAPSAAMGSTVDKPAVSGGGEQRGRVGAEEGDGDAGLHGEGSNEADSPNGISSPSPPVEPRDENSGGTDESEANVGDAAAAVLVGPLVGGLPELSFGTLEEALRYAVDHPDVSEITLAWDGPQRLSPQLRSWAKLKGRALTLRAAPGHRVELEVDMQDKVDVTRGGRPAMVALGPSRWHFEGIHWVWRLPEDLEEREGWSLFALSGDTEVTWKDCTVTVSNADVQGYRMYPEVAVIRVGSEASSGMLSSSSHGLPTELGPQIWLENCVVRGEASLLATDSPRSVLFSWRKGLLATTERAVVVTGIAASANGTPRLECLLEDVLLFADGGLLLTRQSMTRPSLPEIAWHAVHCIAVVQAADPPLAIMEQRGVDPVHWRPPEITGGRNRYGNTDVFLRVVARDEGHDQQEYTLAEMRMKPPTWFGEDLPQPLTRSLWNSLDGPPSERTLSDWFGSPDARRMLNMIQFDDELLDSLPRPADATAPR